MSEQTTAPESATPAQAEAPPERKKHVWEDFKLKRLPQFKDTTVPYNFQDYSVYRAITNDSFLFGLATGTGKTLCSYMAYFYYKSKFPNTKLIVVTKKSAVLQYEGELRNFFNVPDMKAVAVGPDMKKMYKMSGKDYATCRKQAYDAFASKVGDFGSVDALIFNYSVFRSDFKKNFLPYAEKAVQNGVHFFVIYDEATVYKNMGSDTYRCVEKLSKLAKRRVAATATITKGKLEEIYSIFKGIGIQLYPTKEAFMDAHCITFTPPGGNRFQPQIVGYKNIAEFIRLIQPVSIVLRKQDVAPFLPKFISTKTYVEHSEEQYNLVRDIYSGFINLDKYKGGYEEEEPKEIEVTDTHAEAQDSQESEAAELMEGGFQTIQKLTEHGFIKRILCDPRTMTKVGEKDYSIKSPKTQEIIDALREDYTDEKIVIYTQSRLYLDVLANTIRKDPDTPDFYKNVLEIHGGVTGFQREENRKLFYTSKDHNIMILNDAGLEALNLQASNTLLVTTLPRTAGDLVQLAGRISRIGSTHTGLSIRYFLTENSQDIDDYLILQCQLLVMYMTQGDSEEGLIDWELLQSHYGVGRGHLRQAVDQDELLRTSATRLMLAKREKRAKDYI